MDIRISFNLCNQKHYSKFPFIVDQILAHCILYRTDGREYVSSFNNSAPKINFYGIHSPLQNLNNEDF